MTDPDEELEPGLELEGEDILADNEFELDTEYPQVITNKWVYFVTIYRGKILLAVGAILLLILTLAVVTAIVVPLVVVFSGSDVEEIFVVPAPPKYEDEPIRNTTEYQIVLADLESWEKRSKTLDKWIAEINKSPDFTVTRDGGEASARNQYKLDANSEANCNSTWDFRVRDYIDGYWTGNTYIDIKGNSLSQTEACLMPFWPSDDFRKDSKQKCEQDEHQCSTKYSRETRIPFNFHPEFKKCIDLLKMYPWAFENLAPENQHNDITQISKQNWWTFLYKGTLCEETNYEMAWTLLYNTENEAVSGDGIPNYGEWSIRIYTINEGLSEFYEGCGQNSAAALWTSLMDVFGNNDKPC